MGLSSFDTAAIAVGFVLALLATQWWSWLAVSLIGAGAAVLYALAAAVSMEFVVALKALATAVVAFALGQWLMYWLQPERRARARAGDAIPRVLWRQAIVFAVVLLLGFVVAVWPNRWWLPGPLANARIRLGETGLVITNLPMPAVPPDDLDWSKLSDGTRHAMIHGLNDPSLCPTDQGPAFLADCQRYATTMSDVNPTDIQRNVPITVPVAPPTPEPATQPVVGAGVTPDPNLSPNPVPNPGPTPGLNSGVGLAPTPPSR